MTTRTILFSELGIDRKTERDIDLATLGEVLAAGGYLNPLTDAAIKIRVKQIQAEAAKEAAKCASLKTGYGYDDGLGDDEAEGEIDPRDGMGDEAEEEDDYDDDDDDDVDDNLD